MKWILLLMLPVCLFSGCSKGDDIGGTGDYSIVIGSSINKDGLGPNDGTPSGTDLDIPEKLEFVRRPHHFFDPSLDKLKGFMTTFYTDIHIVNHAVCGSDPIRLVLPRGLTFINRSGAGIQHGILIREEIIMIPPGTCTNPARPDTLSFYLGLACLNKTKGLPWEENSDADTREYPIGKDMHGIGPVTDDVNLLELLKLMEDKSGLRLTRHYNPFDALDDDYVMPAWMEIYNEIQNQIWAITDGPGILRKDLEALRQQLRAYE